MKRVLLLLIAVSFSLFVCLQITNGQSLSLTPLWETDSIFGTPESAVYDSLRECIYVSNYNSESGFRAIQDTLKDEFISKVDLQGNVLGLKWVEGLLGPTGIAIFGNKLYAVERGSLAEIDIPSATIENRYPIPDFGFPNDIVISDQGIIYISDSEKNCIYRFIGNTVELWLQDSLIAGPNGLCIDGQNLIIGNSNENSLISASLLDRSVQVIAQHVSSIIDGIVRYKDVYITTSKTDISATDLPGNTVKLMSAGNQNEWYADFAFIEEQKILVFPTLFTKRVAAFHIE